MRARAPLRLVLFIGALGAGSAAASVALALATVPQPGTPSWPALVPLVALLVAAEYLVVRFRYRGEINALNLIEAVLAPLVFAFPGPIAVAAVACAQIVGGLLRRNAGVKAAFNVTQWALATAAGAAVVGVLAPRAGISWGAIGATVLALAVVGVVNQAAFTTVIAIAERQSLRQVARGLGDVMLVGWLAGWAINTALGVLFVLAYAGHPWAALLYPVPLVVLHFAYRGYAGARSDRVRLAGLHRAARVLADPFDPADAIEPFLREVAESFEARAAELVLSHDDVCVVHRVDLRSASAGYATIHLPRTARALETLVLDRPGSLRLSGAGTDPLSRMLAAGGWRDCLAARMADDDGPTGALLVFDQAGLEGFEAGERAVLEALARETMSTLAKGALVARVVEERRRLAEVVGSTSDGIVSIAADGTIESWNRAMERMTGLESSDVVGRRDALASLRMTDGDGKLVALERWAEAGELPIEIRVVDGGRTRRLSCSYSHTFEPAGGKRALVVVARDVTSYDEIQELRAEFGRLARAEAEQREVVERLQEAVMPAPLNLAGLELGVSYVASDPRAPTGGDLYDWVVLPTGEVQVVVADVLGHGVSATKDALTVVHALRMLGLQCCPLDQIVRRADELLSNHATDLVATVIVARYELDTGRVRIAAGGHPPALAVAASGAVQQVAAPGGPIGWPGAGSVATADLTLGPGDALILYTDGLIESGKNILEGEEALIRYARSLAHEDAHDLARGLVDRALTEGTRRDDSVAVVIRRAPAVQTRTWRAEPDPRRGHDIRIELRSWLERRALPAETVNDATLIASELLSNAARAARTYVQLRATVEDGRVAVVVSDDGPGDPGLDRMGVERPALDAEAGRGLHVVRALADDLSILSTPDGTSVKCMVGAAAPAREEAPAAARRSGR